MPAAPIPFQLPEFVILQVMKKLEVAIPAFIHVFRIFLLYL